MKNTRLAKIKRITLVALMLALTILFCFVPVQVFAITLALMILPTIIIALVSDFKTTLLMGTLMGVVNLIAWYTTKASYPTAPIFQNPIVCIVPRVMVGVVSFFVRRCLEKAFFENRILRKCKDVYVRQSDCDALHFCFENISIPQTDISDDIQNQRAFCSGTIDKNDFSSVKNAEIPCKNNAKNGKKTHKNRHIFNQKTRDLTTRQLIYMLSTALGVVANTAFVALFTLLFFNGTTIAQNTIVTIEYVLAFFSVNLAIEVVVFSLLAPPIVLALKASKLA